MRFALAASALLLGVSFANASPKNFIVRSSEQQLAQVESSTAAENFTGTSTKVFGKFRFDPTTHTGGGLLNIDPASIDTKIPGRNQHLQSAEWLDTTKYRNISFAATKVHFTGGSNYRVIGKFTLHGVTKTITVNAVVKYRKANSSTAAAGFVGDVLQVRTSFKVKMSDYGIVIPDMAKKGVSDLVKINLTAFGTTK